MLTLNVPKDRKDAKSDEWVRVEGDIAIVGVSDDAQDSLSAIVDVNLPDVGAALTTGQTFGGVESVKAQRMSICRSPASSLKSTSH